MNLFLILCACFLTLGHIKPVMNWPQVFNNPIDEFCSYLFTNGQSLQFPSTTSSVITKEFKLHFNICSKVGPRNPCGKVSSCLIENTRHFDIGSRFIPIESRDLALRSVNGAPCVNNPNQNYSLTIVFQCSDFVTFQPRFIGRNKNGCNFEIAMMRPDCQPSCTGRLEDGYLLDLRKFSTSIKVKSDNKEFSLTLCGSSTKCGSTDISSCEIVNDTIIPLAARDSQTIHYDINKNELTARGRYKSKGVSRKVEITIKCNWESDLVNAIYKKPQIQGQRYRFEIESSYGCVKLPSQCSVIGNDNSKYNLSGLYRPNNWKVLGVPNGEITINFCGPLNLPSINNNCSNQFSQVCEVSNNTYVNKGSILKLLEPNNDGIRAVFISGSRCANKTSSYSTEIMLQCARKEEGPRYNSYENCVTFLVWKTPFACPSDYYVGDDCLVVDRLGNRNLQKLRSNKDTTILLAPSNLKLDYSLCGPLNASCGPYTNVSACLRNNEHDFVLGWENRKLISDRGVLKLEMLGDLCRTQTDGSTSKVTINFVCSYQSPPPPPTTQMLPTKCRYIITVYTQFACLADNSFGSCTYKKENNFFDLSPLSLKNSSHIIEDGRNSYILNVCGPIVTRPDALCRGNSMVCLRNQTEIDIKKQYVSLGGVSEPQLINGSLIIESTIGDYCGFGHYASKIVFECSSIEELPRILRKDQCLYTFLWRTPYACSAKNCVIPNSTLDLMHLSKKSFKVNLTDITSYEFSVCNDTFIECTNKKCTTKLLKRQLIYEQGSAVIHLKLETDHFSTNRKICEVKLQLGCDNIVNNDHIEVQSVENCTLTVILKTSLICKDLKSKIYGKNNKNQYSLAEPVKNIIIETSTRKKTVRSLNCSISNQTGAANFSLSSIQVSKIKFGYNAYVINLAGKSKDCTGLLCQNDTTILPSAEKCPKITHNYSESSLELQFPQQIPCQDGFYNFAMVLQCRDTMTEAKIVQEGICRLTVLYDSPQACKLVNTSPKFASVSITGIVLGVVTVLFSTVLIVIFLRKRGSRRSYDEWAPLLLSFYQRNTKE